MTMANCNFESELFLEVVRTFETFCSRHFKKSCFQDANYSGNDFSKEDALLVFGVLRAVVEEDLEKLKQFLFFGKTVNVNDSKGNTPLHVAVIKNKLVGNIIVAEYF